MSIYSNRWKGGGATVLKLVENLEPNKHTLYLDNYFLFITYFAVYQSIKYLLLGQSE